MHDLGKTLLATALLVGAQLAALTGSALAHDYKAGSLTIGHPWARATPNGAGVAGGYLSVTNTGSEPDTLIAATLTAADRAEVHRMSMEGGIMRMEALPQGVDVKPGETLELKPGGYHLMFQDLRQPLKKGERVHGTLTFIRAGTVDVDFAVEAIGATAPGKGGSEHGESHGGEGQGSQGQGSEGQGSEGQGSQGQAGGHDH